MSPSAYSRTPYAKRHERTMTRMVWRVAAVRAPNGRPVRSPNGSSRIWGRPLFSTLGAALARCSRRCARGVLVEGLEYSSDRLKRCQERELPVHRFDLESGAEPPIAEVFDVVISLEVAEHLPPAVADRFVDLLAGRARRTVVFSAATPGQGGVDHVNEQPHRYWIERFEKRGFRFDEERSRAWRDSWHGTGVAWWYRRNLMLFHR
jgi:hypothetical protein